MTNSGDEWKPTTDPVVRWSEDIAVWPFYVIVAIVVVVLLLALVVA